VLTIAVVQKNGFAATAADTLTTAPDGGMDSAEYVLNHQKILRVGDSYVAISGPASTKLALKDYFAKGEDCDLSDVDAIYRTWLRLHAALKRNYFLDPDEIDQQSFESSRFDALIANPKGIFGVAAHRSVQQFTKFYSYGSGSSHVLGAMHALYPSPDHSAEDVALAGIEAAAAFDSNTGLPMISYLLALTQSH
jgi:ATP-dependent HslUV protease, peptidase subunit HslV